MLNLVTPLTFLPSVGSEPGQVGLNLAASTSSSPSCLGHPQASPASSHTFDLNISKDPRISGRPLSLGHKNSCDGEERRWEGASPNKCLVSPRYLLYVGGFNSKSMSEWDQSSQEKVEHIIYIILYIYIYNI